MRSLVRVVSAPVVLSSIVLSGWLGAAAAQIQNPTPRVAPGASPVVRGATAGIQSLSSGAGRQPTLAQPGLVLGVTAGELYTDNLALAGRGKPKQSSWITTVQPFIKAAYDTPRLSGLLDYTLRGFAYAGHSGKDQVAQNLDAHGTLTIVPNHLFLDGSAVYARQIINNQLPSGSGVFFLDRNQANVAWGTLSPYWVQGLGKLGNMTLRYSRGRVLYNQRGIPDRNDALLAGISDVTSNAVQFNLVSPKGNTLGWNLGYAEQHLEGDSGRSVEFAVATLGASLQVRPTLRLLADVGKQNKYRPDGTVGHLDASFWDAGFEWATARDDFKLLAGHRFFGRSYNFSWTHSAALLTTTLSYEEQPTDINQRLLGENPAAIAVAPIVASRIPSLAERRVYLMKRATASASYLMPKGRLQVTLFDESRRYFVLAARDERVANADIAWQWQLGPFTTLTPRYRWQRYQFRDGQANYLHDLELDAVHQFNPDNSGSLRVRHRLGDVSSPALRAAHGFRVNVIFLEWTHLF